MLTTKNNLLYMLIVFCLAHTYHLSAQNTSLTDSLQNKKLEKIERILEKDTTKLHRMGESVQIIRQGQINYEIEKDLLKEAYSVAYQNINITITIILAAFTILGAVIGIFGFNGLIKLRNTYKADLDKIRKETMESRKNYKESIQRRERENKLMVVKFRNTFTTDIEKIRNEIKGSQRQFDQLFKAEGEIHCQMKRFQLMSDKLENLTTALSEKNETLTEKVNYLQEFNKELNKEIRFLRNENDKKKGKISNVEETYSQQSAKITQVEKINKEQSQRIRALENMSDIVRSMRKKNFDEAIEFCKNMLKENPKDTNVLNKIVKCHLRLGEYDLAEFYCEQWRKYAAQKDDFRRQTGAEDTLMELYLFAKNITSFEEKLEDYELNEYRENVLEYLHVVRSFVLEKADLKEQISKHISKEKYQLDYWDFEDLLCYISKNELAQSELMRTYVNVLQDYYPLSEFRKKHLEA